MRTTTSQKIGFGLSLLIGILMMGPSAAPKFIDWEGKAQIFEKMGLTIELAKQIGIIEIIAALIYIIPRTSFLGAILLTGYLGGAILTHMRVNESVIFPIILGVLLWIAEGLRNPEVFRLAFGGTKPATDSTSTAPSA
jgi:hypothetical protein